MKYHADTTNRVLLNLKYSMNHVYSFTMSVPTVDVDFIEKADGSGLLDLEAIIGVVSVRTSVHLNSIESMTDIKVMGDQPGLKKVLAAIFNQLNTIRELNVQTQTQIARINNLELKMNKFKQHMTWKLEKESAKSSHYETQANKFCNGSKVVVPFAPSQSEDSDSDSSSSSSSILTSSFAAYKQTIYDQKVRKHQKNQRSALSSRVMRSYLTQFFDACPQAPEGVLTSLSDAQTAFVRFIRKTNPAFRRVVTTRGFKAQFTAHIRNRHSQFVQEDEDGNVSLTIVIDWPATA